MLTFFRLTFFLLLKDRSRQAVAAVAPPEKVTGRMLDLTALHGGIYPVETILYFKEIENYCYMNYSSNGRQVEIYLKISLKKMQDLLKPYPWFVKCHCSYVVNTEKILKSIGPKRKMTLRLQNCKTEIPVSKSHANEFIEVIRNKDSKSSEK